MHRIYLPLLRFCLCTWVGTAMFFVVAVLGVTESILSERPPINPYSEPTYFLPPYFGFAFVLLVPALLCACGNLWNPRIGRIRRAAMALVVIAALAMVTVDYFIIYRELAEMFGSQATTIPATRVVTLYLFSRLLKKAVLGASILAAILALGPELRDDSQPDPAL